MIEVVACNMDAVDIEPQLPVESAPTIPSLRKYYVSISILVVIVLGIAGGYVLDRVTTLKNLSQKTRLDKKVNLSSNKTADRSLEGYVGKQVLVNFVPNFEHLQYKDLPSSSDFSLVESYKGNQVMVGFGKVIEYNSSSNTYIRTSTRDLELITSAALIKDTLYVIGASESGYSPTRSHRIFEIDMSTGKIVKAYLTTTFLGSQAVNLDFKSNKGLLWGSSEDGIFRYDPVSKELRKYSYTDIHFPSQNSCRGGILTVENGYVKVRTEAYCDDYYTSTYDQNSDKWVTVQDLNSNVDQWYKATMDALKVPQPSLPFYSSFSDIHGDKRYLFAPQGIYILKEKTFPVQISAIKLDRPGFVYVTKSESFALLFDTFNMQPDADYSHTSLGEMGYFKLVDLQNFSLTDLIQSSGLSQEPVDKYFYFENNLTYNIFIERVLENMKFVEDGSVIKVYSRDIPLFSVDTTTKKMSFLVPIPTSAQ